MTNNPQVMAATTATIDLLIPVNKTKDRTTESKSVRKKFLKKKDFIFRGKCENEMTKLIQVKTPKNNPSYILLRRKFHFN